MTTLAPHEGADLLRSMTSVELQLFAVAAAALALRHGDVGAGLVEALKLSAQERGPRVLPIVISGGAP